MKQFVTKTTYQRAASVSQRQWRAGLLAAVTLTCAATAGAAVDSAGLPIFTPIQEQLFAVAGSLANAWADIDGDGDPDLAVSTKHGEILLYENNAGHFRSIGAKFKLPIGGDEIRGLSWGDFDGDGDPDLHAGSNVFPIPSRSYLYRHDGVHFTEIAQAAGAALPGRYSRQANWVDFDGDGDLDLYAGNRAGANQLLRNNSSQGVARFEATAIAHGAVDIRRTVGACWFDYDRDGDLDLFLANQSGDSDALWRNDGSGFVDVAPALGIDQTQRWLNEGGVGCAPGDYDNDGDVDLYVGTYGNNLLYRNDSVDGRPRFVDVAQSAGLTDPHSVVGAAWGDADNDGDLDLFVASYETVDGVQEPHNALFLNTDGHFENVLSSDDPANAADHGVVWVDYDLDGDLDLSLTDGYGAEGGHPLLRNELPEAARARAFRVRVRDADGHATQAGAELRLVDSSGPRSGLRLLSTGGGYNAQSELDVHFVLPQSCGGCAVEVRFPGALGEPSRFGPVDLRALKNQAMVVKRPR